METEEIIEKEKEMMGGIRELIHGTVGIRLEAQKGAAWMDRQHPELTAATEEMADAIDALYRAETAMGNAHQYLLVSQSTLMHETDSTEP